MAGPVLSRSQASRSVERLRPHLSPVTLERLQALLALLSDATSRTTAGTVQRKLFPDSSSPAANKALQRMRAEVSHASRLGGVEVTLRVSDAKSVGAEKREVWFEGTPLPIVGVNRTEELERVGEALIHDAQGRPLGTTEPRVRLTEFRNGKPVVRLFASYAHADGGLPHIFIKDLGPRLSGSSSYAFEVWQDVDLMPGDDWDAGIRRALGSSHLGLLLLTPAFFASEYARKVELAALISGRGSGVEGKRVIPVLLRNIDFAHTDTGGVEVRQIFRGPTPSGRSFPQRASQTRDEWMNGLVAGIHTVVQTYADIDTGPPVLLAPSSKSFRIRAQHMLSNDLKSVEECLIEDAPGRVTRLDATVLDGVARQSGGSSVSAVDYIVRWARDPSAPALFALLGEYGMGKTITCQRVVRALEEETADAPDSLPMPLYFDLRRLTSLRGRDEVPRLTDLLDECIDRGWPLRGPKPSAEELLEQASNQPMLFVFDGLDEALVHLSESHGREFTRELLRVRELSEQAKFRTRVLLSCRTHYFRSLQEQDAHFTGHDRGRTTAGDYAALMLLPLGERQVREYLSRALPEIDVERATALVRSVHNLEELAARPYTLRLISEQVPKIEELRARGQTVRGVTLYGLLVDKWLGRDGGKHHIKPDHKRKLMTHLAAWTWNRGARHIAATELEDWFGAWLEEDDAMRRRYGQVDRDKLEEDLRTATFLVREDDDSGRTLGFTFAHTSMQEYFLSCYLFQALDENRPDRWNLHNVSDETWSFFAQHLEQAGNRGLMTRMREWALGNVRDTRWLVFRYVLHAHQRAWPMPSTAGIDLSGIDLQGTRIRGPLDLSASRWDGANLRQVDWEDVVLNDASFQNADFRFSMWNRVQACRASFTNARGDGAVFRQVDFGRASGVGATGTRCSFIRCVVPEFWRDDAYIAPVSTSRGLAERTVVVNQVNAQSCAWSPDGTRVVSAGADGTVRVWDAASGVTLGMWEGHRGSVTSCAWSPDGTRVVSAGVDGTVRVWDAVSGASLGVSEGPAAGSCGWSPDGTRVVSAGDDGTVRVWDAVSGASLGVWEGHERAVTSSAWSADGTRVVSASHDGTVRVWDAASGASLGVWRHGASVQSCAWSPDGTRVLSAGEGGTVRMWEAASGACGLAIVLLDGQHASYVPGRSGTEARILEASEQAWRWLRWQVRYEDKTVDILPAEAFGELPAPAQFGTGNR
jgi:hypothetical protein